MKLSEFLKTADKDTIYFVGGGSGYLAIGTPQEIDLEDLTAQEKLNLTNAVIRATDNVTAAEERLQEAKNALASTEKKRENFVPFADREVVDTYYSPCRGNHCVIIQGKENGEFWFEKEKVLKKKATRIADTILDTFAELLEADEAVSEKDLAQLVTTILTARKENRECKGEKK